MNRRVFIRESGRWGILAVLAGLTMFLFRNRDISGSSVCGENQFCKNCNKFGACDLPQAENQS